MLGKATPHVLCTHTAPEAHVHEASTTLRDRLRDLSVALDVQAVAHELSAV